MPKKLLNFCPQNAQRCSKMDNIAPEISCFQQLWFCDFLLLSQPNFQKCSYFTNKFPMLSWFIFFCVINITQSKKTQNVLTAWVVFVTNNMDGRFHGMLAKYVYGSYRLPSLVYTDALQLPCHYTIVASRRTLKPAIK